MWSNSWVNRCWPFKGSSRVKGKLSCTVPRGVGHRNVARLLDFPQIEMMEKLEQLVENQPLLMSTKSKLSKILLKQQLNIGKLEEEAKAYANKVADRLIPNDGSKLQITGLRHIYYNCPANLWPIAGPVNRAKGKKDSIKIAIAFVFKRIQALLGKQQVMFLAKKTAKQFGIPAIEMKVGSEKKIQKTIDRLSDAILSSFNEQGLSYSKKYGVLPYIVRGQEIIPTLAFFQETAIGKMSRKFASETAINAKRSLMIARDITFHAMTAELAKDDAALKKLQSINKGAIKIVKILGKSLRKKLEQSLQADNISPLLTREISSSSDSSLDSVGIKAMTMVAADIMSSVDEFEQKLLLKRDPVTSSKAILTPQPAMEQNLHFKKYQKTPRLGI